MSPPVIGTAIIDSSFSYAFDETAIQRSEQFAKYYKQVADAYNCTFVDAAKYVSSSDVDGLHLSEDAHAALANALKEVVLSMPGMRVS